MNEMRPEPICGYHVAELRELLGSKIADYVFISSVLPRQFRYTGEDSMNPIKENTPSLLVRYLLEHPEYSPIPEMPTAEEFSDFLNKNFTKTRFGAKYIKRTGRGLSVEKNSRISGRRLGLLSGTSAWAGNDWFRGTQPTMAVRRLWYVIMKAYEMDGIKAIDNYFDVLEKELAVRGIEGGIEELLGMRSWTTRNE